MPQFQVIRIDTSEACVVWSYEDDRNVTRVFDSGETAAAFAANMMGHNLHNDAGEPIKYQVRPFVVDEESWRERERQKLESGRYSLPVWKNESWWLASDAAKNHFCHVSTHNGNMVAYTQDSTRGAQDVQTRVRPGRYLSQHFPELGPDSIASWAAEHNRAYGSADLRFASTPADIEQVYESGPSSCMSGEASDFPDAGIQPTRVYGAGDLAIAYILREGASSGFRATARAICWPEKKIYGRIYGASERLESLLADAGFKYNSGGFYGARLLKIRDRNDYGYVCPYLDHADTVGLSNCGKFLTYGGGDMCARSTSGSTEEESRDHCARCGDGMDEGDGHYIENRDESWCEHCADNNAFACAWTDRLHSDEEMVELANGDCVSQRAFDRNGFTCIDCDEAGHANDSRYSEHDSETRCESCHNEHEAAQESEDEESGDSFHYPAPSRTVNDPRQVTMTLSAPENVTQLWEIAFHDSQSGYFVDLAFVSYRRLHGTRAEAEEMARRLGQNHRYYTYTARPIERERLTVGESIVATYDETTQQWRI